MSVENNAAFSQLSQINVGDWASGAPGNAIFAAGQSDVPQRETVPAMAETEKKTEEPEAVENSAVSVPDSTPATEKKKTPLSQDRLDKLAKARAAKAEKKAAGASTSNAQSLPPPSSTGTNTATTVAISSIKTKKRSAAAAGLPPLPAGASYVRAKPGISRSRKGRDDLGHRYTGPDAAGEEVQLGFSYVTPNQNVMWTPFSNHVRVEDLRQISEGASQQVLQTIGGTIDISAPTTAP